MSKSDNKREFRFSTRSKKNKTDSLQPVEDQWTVHKRYRLESICTTRQDWNQLRNKRNDHHQQKARWHARNQSKFMRTQKRQHSSTYSRYWTVMRTEWFRTQKFSWAEYRERYWSCWHRCWYKCRRWRRNWTRWSSLRHYSDYSRYVMN